MTATVDGARRVDSGGGMLGVEGKEEEAEIVGRGEGE